MRPWGYTGWAILVLAGGAGALFSLEDDDLAVWVAEGRWARGTETVERTPRQQLRKAKRLEEIGDMRQAAEEHRRLADVYRESDQAEEALILSAKDYLAAGDFTKCREQLDELRRRYARQTYLDLMGQVEINLARGYLEGRGEGGTYRLSSRLRKARGILEHLYSEDPEGRWADDALLALGESYDLAGRHEEAIEKYKELLKKYPRSDLRAEAEARLAESLLKREPLPDYSSQEAQASQRRMEELRAAVESGESNADLAVLEEQEKQLHDRLAQKRYEQAIFYSRNGHFRAAEVYLELIVARYPESVWRRKAEETLKGLRQR